MKERAYKYRFYPTPEQAELLAQTFGCVRVVYNKVLGWRTDAFNQDKSKIGYSKASAYHSVIKDRRLYCNNEFSHKKVKINSCGKTHY